MKKDTVVVGVSGLSSARGLLRAMTRDGAPSQTNKLAERLHEIREKGGLRRDASVGSVDLEARTVELSFSSEVEYERWFGIEVLSHDAGAVDMSRITNGAAVLWMHDWDDQRGVVESARIDSDRKGRAVVRFSKSPAGEQLMQDVADKIITKVSVGYLVNGMKLTEERGDIDVYTVTDWLPFEISFVSVPADDTVGVGRSAIQNPQEEPQKTSAQHSASINDSAATRVNIRDNHSMKYRYFTDAQGNKCRVAVDDAGNDAGSVEIVERAGADVAAAQARGQDTERARVRDLTEMGRQYGAVDKALQFVAEGKTPDEFRRELLADFATQRTASRPLNEQVKDGEVGLTNKEARRFSVMTAIRALANPSNRAYQEAAAFEFECSRAAADKAGKQSRGLMIPSDVLNRAFSIGTGSGLSGTGAGTVATNLLADQFIELLRHKTWALKRVTTMGGLVGNVDIPRQNSATQAYWVGEGAAPSESDPGIDQIGFSPKTLAAYTDITRNLMLQSTPDAELIVRNDLLKVMALALDYAVLYGTGPTNKQPTGLKSISGINAVALTAAMPAFTEYVNMESEIAAMDADVGAMSYVIKAAARGAAKTTLKFPGVNGSQTIWEQGNTINGYPVDVTNQLVDGDFFMGVWSEFIVAMWAGLDMMVDPYSLSTSGGTRIVVFQDVDMNVRHAQSFTYGAMAA